MISEQAILGYIWQAYSRGWSLYARGSLTAGWHLSYKSRLYSLDAYLDVDEDWVYLQYPVLRTRPVAECRLALYEYLLRANDQMFLAKFGLFRTEEPGESMDWVALTVECPADGFDAAAFRRMTEALTTYAEQFDREILCIALDPTIAAVSAPIRTAGPARAAFSHAADAVATGAASP